MRRKRLLRLLPQTIRAAGELRDARRMMIDPDPRRSFAIALAPHSPAASLPHSQDLSATRRALRRAPPPSARLLIPPSRCSGPEDRADESWGEPTACSCSTLPAIAAKLAWRGGGRRRQ